MAGSKQMTDVERALNKLREQRRDAQRGREKAKKAGNQIAEQRFKREVARLDEEITNLEAK
jgi:hypothetical protein